jgi:glycine/D-amino acid oxidase-like deaminating enzyme
MTRIDARYGLAVVGAGIAGAMTAVLAHRRHPDLEIVVIDRSIAGLGATAYSAFLGLPFGYTPAIRALTTRSIALYRELKAEIPALPIVEVPLVGVCAEGGLDVARARLTDPAAALPPPGPHGEGSVALSRAFPGFVVPSGHVVLDGLGATRCLGGIVQALVGVLTAREQRPRARCAVMEGGEVVRISSDDGGHRIELHDGRALAAERVALCVGPWLGSGLPQITGAGVEVRTKKVVSLLIPEDPPDDAPVIYLFEHEAFLMPQPEHRRWLFSFRSEEWDVAPSAALRLSRDDLARATAILDLHVPRGVPVPFGAQVFCDAYTPTRDPLVTGLAGHPGLVVIGGAGGSGVRLAPAMAERGLEELGL